MPAQVWNDPADTWTCGVRIDRSRVSVLEPIPASIAATHATVPNTSRRTVEEVRRTAATVLRALPLSAIGSRASRRGSESFECGDDLVDIEEGLQGIGVPEAGDFAHSDSRTRMPAAESRPLGLCSDAGQ